MTIINTQVNARRLSKAQAERVREYRKTLAQLVRNPHLISWKFQLTLKS